MIELGYGVSQRHPLITPMLRDLGYGPEVTELPLHESAIQGVTLVGHLSARLHRLPYDASYVMVTERGSLGRGEEEAYCHLSLDDDSPESYIWISSMRLRTKSGRPTKSQYRRSYPISIPGRGTVGELLRILSIYDIMQPIMLTESFQGPPATPIPTIFPSY